MAKVSLRNWVRVADFRAGGMTYREIGRLLGVHHTAILRGYERWWGRRFRQDSEASRVREAITAVVAGNDITLLTNQHLKLIDRFVAAAMIMRAHLDYCRLIRDMAESDADSEEQLAGPAKC